MASSLPLKRKQSEDEEFLTLSISTKPSSQTIFQPPPPPPSNIFVPFEPVAPIPREASTSISQRPAKVRRSPVQTLKQGKSENIPPPYPWATSNRATVHNIHYLLSKGINIISGEVQCRRCERTYQMQYNLQEKFREVAQFISSNKDTMHDRAPDVWMNPSLPDCKFCEQQNCVKPILTKKKSINWLFLLLGQLLGCCKLAELKYFCKHTRNHRTGAKNRVLYLTYLGLCKQLDPEGPFDR